MDNHFTIMVIPEREKRVRSFRIPKTIFNGAVFLCVLTIFLIGILVYDYQQILGQVYKNKHLSIENRQLKEQIQLFQMKINSLTEDIDRIHTFEKKLRIITGIKEQDLTRPIQPADDKSPADSTTNPEKKELDQKQLKSSILNKNFQDDEEYQNLKELYEQKIATTFGLQTGYSYTKEWSNLTQQSFALAEQFAKFDFQFKEVKKFISILEVNIHDLDLFILDNDSFLKSTPTLLPAKGWITSYYGPRKSHYARRIKMHEGIDIGAKNGSAVVATADGIVTYSGKKPGFGYFVQLDHGYGIETIYGHAKKLMVKSGQRVKRGQMIARVGSTGLSTGPHVHYEVRINGTPVDPLYYILD